MAILKSVVAWNGTVDGLTCYRLPGDDRTIVRRKGGVPGHVIKTAPNYQNSRRNSAEFGGRSCASGWIMRRSNPGKSLGDGSIGGRINAVLKPIQESDTSSPWGQRHVLISRNGNLLEGLLLNEVRPFTSIVRSPLTGAISRSELKATVSIPALYPQMNFFPSHISMYRIVAVLGVVPDLLFSEKGYGPSHPDYARIGPVTAETPWYPSIEGSPAFDLALRLPEPLPDENNALLLSIGIVFGIPVSNHLVRKDKTPGSGIILCVR